MKVFDKKVMKTHETKTVVRPDQDDVTKRSAKTILVLGVSEKPGVVSSKDEPISGGP